MPVEIRRATPDDAAALAQLGRSTFVETFVDRFRMPYPPADLETYLASAYGVATVRESLIAPQVAWWIAHRDGQLAGFSMAGPCGLPHADVTARDGELKRIYVLDAHQGFAVGSALLAATLAWLESTFEGDLWLGVWSGNDKAQQLYRRRGFAKVGEYEFPVGTVRDHELIYRRPRG